MQSVRVVVENMKEKDSKSIQASLEFVNRIEYLRTILEEEISQRECAPCSRVKSASSFVLLNYSTLTWLQYCAAITTLRNVKF